MAPQDELAVEAHAAVGEAESDEEEDDPEREQRRTIAHVLDSDGSSGAASMPISPCVDLNAVLGRAVELGASDIHLKVGQPPVLRRDGELGLLPTTRRSTTATWRPRSRSSPIMTPAKLAHFHESGRARHRLHGRRACRASASTATASAARSRSPSA